MVMIIIYVICSFVLLFYKNKKYLHMLQQNLYNENNRYLSWLVRNYKYFFDLDLFIFIISILGYIVFYKRIAYT